MPITLELFANQYLPDHQRAAALATLADHSEPRSLDEWRRLWQRALLTPVQ